MFGDVKKEEEREDFVSSCETYVVHNCNERSSSIWRMLLKKLRERESDIATYAVAVITAISCSLPVKCLFSLVSFALSFCPDVGDGGV